MKLSSGIVTLSLALWAGSFVGQQPDPAALQQYHQLVEATKLDRDGARPFHLKIESQLFDLKGKPSESGAIEEWWLAPDQFRIEINSGDIHEVILTGEPDQVMPGVHRSEFLLRQLLSSAVSPLSPLNSAEAVSEVKRDIGGHILSCFALAIAVKGDLGRDTNYCREPGGDNVRLIVSPQSVSVRNRVGVFAGTNVALDLSISYLGRPAVSGKVVLLQVFDPTASGSPILHVSKTYNTDPHIPIAAVVAGHRLSTPPIAYPLYARREQISGVVLLACRITREGKIGAMDVVASSNVLFNEAGMDGVRQWLFTPFKFKGQPASTQVLVRIYFNP